MSHTTTKIAVKWH